MSHITDTVWTALSGIVDTPKADAQAKEGSDDKDKKDASSQQRQLLRTTSIDPTNRDTVGFLFLTIF